MDLDTIFKCENVDLLFKSETASGNYIAEANDRFSEYMERQEIRINGEGSLKEFR